MDALELFRGLADGGSFGGGEHKIHPQESNVELPPVGRNHEVNELEHSSAKTGNPAPERSDGVSELWDHYAA